MTTVGCSGKTRRRGGSWVDVVRLLARRLASSRPRRRRLLILSKCLPRPDRGAGHVRLMEVLRILVTRHDVTFGAESSVHSPDIDDSVYQRELEGLGIRVLSERDQWHALEHDAHDVIMFEWFETAARNLPWVRERFPRTPTLIDTVDVHFAREMMMAEVHGDRALHTAALATKQRELQTYRQVDCLWAASIEDKRILSACVPERPVDVVPTIHRVTDVDRSRVERNTLLFVGNFWHRPNVDAVLYFCRDVLPLVVAEVPDVVLSVIGHAPPAEFADLVSANVRVIGWVPDTGLYLQRCQISVAPLRYGGGMKGKVGEAMSAGIPTVTTPVGVQGLDARDGEHLLVADTPAAFAAAVVRLLRDEALQQSLGRNARAYAARHLSPAAVAADVLASLERVAALAPAAGRCLPP